MLQIKNGDKDFYFILRIPSTNCLNGGVKQLMMLHINQLSPMKYVTEQLFL